MYPEENGSCTATIQSGCETPNRERGIDLNAIQELIQALPNQQNIRAINFDLYGATIQYHNNAVR